MMMASSDAKILVVDDEPINIEILSEAVSRLGDVIIAKDGESAIDLCKLERPDIVLLDVMMPAMDGYAVCRELLDDPDTRNIPIVFVTALSQDSDEAMGIEMGAVDYITKPISAPVVAARIGSHLELKKTRDYLEEIAFVDALTGIANRRRFDEAIRTEWQRALRTGAQMSLLLMDIDHFKQYNDNYGHQNGDECLRKIASALNSVVKRPGDLVARYGGEEFTCLLPETDAEGAHAIAGTLCQKVRDLGIPHEYSSTADTVTLSIGAATVFVGLDTSINGLIETADKNLYAAKKEGRNRVSVGQTFAAALGAPTH